jgi:cytochrome c biogenesis protein CcmG/thiol:disulfide interchange protein DsbE
MSPPRRRSRRGLAWLALIAAVGVALAILAFVPFRPSGAPPNASLVGHRAPPLEASGLDGRRHSLSDGRGRLSWVNFWATSCEPCRTEMPAMQRLAEAYGDRLLILGVDYGESEPSVRDFVERYGISYPILLDPTLANFYAWSSRDGLPRHYFVRDGVVLREVIGPIDPAQMASLVTELVGRA